MIDILLSAVLPVFTLLAIGYVLGRAGVFDQAMASSINRFVFLVSVPALVFGLLARSPFDQFNWLALGAFAMIEVVMYATGFAVARYVFRRDPREALLIGLATAFANPCLSGYHPHPLYVVCLLGLQARAGAGALRRRSG